MAEIETEVLAAVPYTGGRQVRITRQEFKGFKLVDIRLWRDEQLPLDGEAEWRPTRKGISIRLEKFPEVLEALKEAAGKLEG